jgi:hypothetical protein
MADREIIAATLAAAIIGRNSKSNTYESAQEAVKVYREVLGQLGKELPQPAVQGRPSS